MAGMTTVLTELSANGNSRTFYYTGHTMSEPRLVIQKRKVPAGATGTGEDLFQVISSTEDASGELLTSKVLFEAKVRRPSNGITGDVTAALAIFRDIVASDEFTAMVNTQANLA